MTREMKLCYFCLLKTNSLNLNSSFGFVYFASFVIDTEGKAGKSYGN